MKKFDVAMLLAFLLVVLAFGLLLTSLPVGNILGMVCASICTVLCYAVLIWGHSLK